MILFRHFFRAIFTLVLMFLLFVGPFSGDWLRSLVAPISGITRVRAAMQRALCRFRVLFAGGLFIQARPA